MPPFLQKLDFARKNVPLGVRVGTAADRVFFSINDVTLVLATVSDKANRALPPSMLLEWEDQDINRVSVASKYHPKGLEAAVLLGFD